MSPSSKKMQFQG